MGRWGLGVRGKGRLAHAGRDGDGDLATGEEHGGCVYIRWAGL